jgi:hypothetical protein
MITSFELYTSMSIMTSVLLLGMWYFNGKSHSKMDKDKDFFGEVLEQMRLHVADIKPPSPR